MDWHLPRSYFEEDMMSQRFTLFYAGYTAYAPALYFHQLDFIDICRNEESEAVKNYISDCRNNLQSAEYECTTHIKTAASVAEHLDIEIPALPTNSQDYFQWLARYTESFEREFPMARIDHYYFLFARKISEIICNLGLLQVYLRFPVSAAVSFDLSRKTEKCLKDIEYILFKLMAAAALLSSEPRQNYFNVYYKAICQEFTPFKGIEAGSMEEPELRKLGAALAEYELSVMNGFKKCIGLLKELGI